MSGRHPGDKVQEPMSSCQAAAGKQDLSCSHLHQDDGGFVIAWVVDFCALAWFSVGVRVF